MLIRNSIRSVVVGLLLCAAFDSDALAAFGPGDVFTFTQDVWSLPIPILTDNYNSLYFSQFGQVEVGISGPAGRSMLFTSVNDLISYLPASGPIGPLTSDYIDPTLTASGAFGGEVVALRLNIDFSDAGVTLGDLKVPFADLQLYNFTAHSQININGLSVRQFSAQVNNLLGGGSSLFYSIPQLYPVTAELNGSFNLGFPNQFAQDHLRVVPGVPGDYNNNGIVDAADYVVWRKGLGTAYTQNQYNVWRNHFGQTTGSGSGAIANAAVPEPASFVLLLIGLLASCPCRRAKMEQAHLFISRSDMDRCPESSTNASCDR